MRWIAAAYVCAAALAAGTARADDQAATVVAVLPVAWSGDSLAIYSRTVAAALAREIDDLEGVSGVAVALGEDIPASVDLVVDGRLIEREGDTVTLQVSVRDPELGAVVTTLPPRSAPLARIDGLVAEAGASLRAELRRELRRVAERRAARAAPLRLAVTVVAGERARSVRGGRAAPPRVAVLLATVSGEPGALPVSAIATSAAFELVRRLGFEPVAAEARRRDAAEAGEVASKAGAIAALQLRVLGLELGRAGVLLARGRFRVTLVAATGATLFDRVVQTDTVVGSRGDRADAVVKFVADQVMAIVSPHVARAVAR
jgi:hypothetical protein